MSHAKCFFFIIKDNQLICLTSNTRYILRIPSDQSAFALLMGFQNETNCTWKCNNNKYFFIHLDCAEEINKWLVNF